MECIDNKLKQNTMYEFKNLEELILKDRKHKDGSLCIRNCKDIVELNKQTVQFNKKHRGEGYEVKVGLDACRENHVVSYTNGLNFRKTFVLNFEKTGTLGLTLTNNRAI